MTTTSLIKKALAGLLLLSPAAWAETSVSQEMEAGLQSVQQNNPEAKFQEYRDVPDGIVIKRYALTEEGDHHDLSLEAKNIRQEDQSALLGLNVGKLNIRAAYDQSPHRWSTISRTLYTEVSPGVFELPDGMQGVLQGVSGNVTNWYNVMSSTYAGLAHEQILATRQDKSSIGLGYEICPHFTLDLDFSQEKKTGYKLHPFAFGRNYSIELPRPYDQKAYESSLKLSHSGEKMTWVASYGMSLFQNDIEKLVYDNFKSSIDRAGNTSSGIGGKTGHGSLPPDNSAHTVAFNMGLDLPSKTQLQADASYTLMEQDQELMPFSSNSAITITNPTQASNNAASTDSLPEKTAGAKQTLVVQNYALTNRLFKNVDWGVKVRSEQLGNDSKEIHFDGHAQLDQAWQANTAAHAETVRFAYRKVTLGANADWRVLQSLNVGADATRETSKREHREFKETVEDAVIGRFNYKPLQKLTVRGRYVNSNRSARDFEVQDYIGLTGNYIELPGLRRFDLASRLRNSGDLTLQTWSGPLSVSVNGGLAHDKFRGGDGLLFSSTMPVATNNQDQLYGLLENRIARGGIDLDLDLSDQVGLYAFYQVERQKGLQRANTGSGTVNQDASNDWMVESNDRYDSAGVGADVQITGKWKLMLAWDMALSEGSTHLTSLGSSLSTKVSPPVTKTSKRDASIKAQYQPKKDYSLVFGYLYEVYYVTDYATDNIPLISALASTSQTNIFLGDSIMDYKAHIFSVVAKYKF